MQSNRNCVAFSRVPQMQKGLYVLATRCWNYSRRFWPQIIAVMFLIERLSIFSGRRMAGTLIGGYSGNVRDNRLFHRWSWNFLQCAGVYSCKPVKPVSWQNFAWRRFMMHESWLLELFSVWTIEAAPQLSISVVLSNALYTEFLGVHLTGSN